MSEQESIDVDEDRERVKRFVRFAGFILIIMIGWYGFKIGGGF